MCFRPAGVQKPIKCPNCGTLNPPTQKICRKCQTELQTEQKK